MEVEEEINLNLNPILIGNVFLLEDKSLTISCILCESNSNFLSSEDLFKHIMEIHICEYEEEYIEEDIVKTPESQTPKDKILVHSVEILQCPPSILESPTHTNTQFINLESQDLEEYYLEEEYILEEMPTLTEFEAEKYQNYVQNFEIMQPFLNWIKRCPWIWSGRSMQSKLKNCCLRLLRQKYFQVYEKRFSTRDLSYRINLLKGMRRMKQMDQKYCKDLEFFNNKNVNIPILKCPENDCIFEDTKEEALCDHIYKFHMVHEEKVYDCESCDFKTKTYKTFVSHIRVCEEKLPKKHTSFEIFQNKSKPEKPNLKCFICGENFSNNVEIFNEHMRQHNKIVRNTSSVSPKIETRKIFIQPKNISKRTQSSPQKQVSAPEIVECDICVLNFKDISEFNQHMRMHNKIQVYKCKTCHKISKKQICEDCS